jgi:phage tail-like protein
MFGQIIVQLQGGVVQTLTLQSEVLTIGRAPDNGLVLPFDLVSMYHAELRITDRGAFITDLDSKYGTFVAASKLLANQPYFLLPGIAMQVGPYVLTYKAQTKQEVEALGEPVSEEAPPLEITPEPPVVNPPRAQLPVPLPQDQARYLRFLPIIFHDNDMFDRLLKIFETVWEPLEWRQTHIDFYFDARTAPSNVLQGLSNWISFDIDSRATEDRKRRLILEGAQLHRWRGTSYALTRIIELHTDISPTIEDDPNKEYTFHIKLPKGTSTDIKEVVQHLVETHKPAHTGYTLQISR